MSREPSTPGRALKVSTRFADELGAWVALCEALGITVVDRGCGDYLLTVPAGVSVPEPPS
jgi:hypothetical protein